MTKRWIYRGNWAPWKLRSTYTWDLGTCKPPTLDRGLGQPNLAVFPKFLCHVTETTLLARAKCWFAHALSISGRSLFNEPAGLTQSKAGLWADSGLNFCCHLTSRDCTLTQREKLLKWPSYVNVGEQFKSLVLWKCARKTIFHYAKISDKCM